MLKVILNRLRPQAEEIIVEEQAGFRARGSTTEQIFNPRILCEKYLQHQQNLYHVLRRAVTNVDMGRAVTNVDRTCGPTHLLVFSGNKICLN